jgi:hypothetical protein
MAAGENLEPYYQRLLPRAESLYRSFFTIPRYGQRRDLRWTTNKKGHPMIEAPFLDPGKANVRDFLQVNIEDEWRFGDWSLKLAFVPRGNHAYIRFVPGATANVNGLGGNRITMDANQPLSEYDAQWTIRHEYGHVIGLPDCYVEFYQEEKGTIINYQIDTDNLMCSRRGHIQESHVSELLRVYGPGNRDSE